MGCLNCGKELVNTPGKRPKQFCNVTCRSGYWQKKKRSEANTEFKGVIPTPEMTLNQSIEYNPNLSFDSTKMNTTADKPAMYQKGDKKRTSGGLTKHFEPAIIYDQFGKPIDTSFIDGPVVNEIRSYITSEVGTNLLVAFSFPKDFAGILRLAKEWKGDKAAFKSKIDGLSLTPNQKSMILSKLK